MDDNELLSLWYGYILQDWLYFEEGVVEGVNVSMGGKRANSVSKEAMKAAIRVDSNPTEEERSADVFFRRTIEIPNTINADSCKIIQEAGHFTYDLEVSDLLAGGYTFTPCVDLQTVVRTISENVKEIRSDGQITGNKITITNLSELHLPNATGQLISFTFHVVSENCPLGVNITIGFESAEEECKTTNNHALSNIVRDYSISYEESGKYIIYEGNDDEIGCSGGVISFSVVDGMCNGGKVTFELKLNGFTAELSDDNVVCRICDSVISSYTESPNVTVTAVGSSDVEVNDGTLTVDYDSPVDTSTVSIKWSDGETTTHNIFSNGKSGSRPSRISQNNNITELINIYPNHLR